MTSIDIPIVDTLDDGIAYATPAQYWITNQTVAGTMYNVGLRFLGITLGLVITAAYIRYYVTGTTGSPGCNMRCTFEKSASPVQITTYADYFGRSLTTAYVDFVVETDTGWHNSPSLVSIIQELVNAYGYNSGIMQAFLRPISGDYDVNLNDYGTDPTKATILHIEYTLGSRRGAANFLMF